MARSIDGQVVVIAGASSGIGRTTARLLAERGATVVASARSATDLTTLVEEIRATGGAAQDVVADVRSQEDMQELARATVERYGRIDTWVACAAVSVYGKAWEIPAHEYDAVMRTNWLGHVHGALAAVPHLRASKGTFIAIGSVESVRAVPLHAPYTASKFALRAFCDSLRMDLDAEDAGVAVSLIMPAAIDTPFFEHSRSYADGAPKPPPPVYSPESVAEAILRMAERPQRQVTVGGSAFGFISGQKLAPALTDRLMTARQSMLRMQQSDAPPGGRDNVDAPVEGSGAERGGHGGRRSLAAAVTTARPLVKRAAGLGAAAAGVVASRVATRERRTRSATPAPPATPGPETTERRVIQLPQERTDVPDPGRET
jgi:short-subunit dehydrogenase